MRTTLRYFTRDELQPRERPAAGVGLPQLVSEGDLEAIETLVEKLEANNEIRLDRRFLADHGSIAMFLAMLQALGGLASLERSNDDSLRFGPAGQLAKHLPRVLYLYLRDRIVLFDDWNRRSTTADDGWTSLDFLHAIEMNRIERARTAGHFPLPLAERPVAFAVIKAYDKRGRAGYLFEVNKDWGRYNLIGGKQEPVDGGDYFETVRREIHEELGIQGERLVLTPMTTRPIEGFSLSGNVGTLARYPCMLYHARVAGSLNTRLKDCWLSEDFMRAQVDAPDPALMVNTAYLRFLLEDQPSRLSELPPSTDETIVIKDLPGTPAARLSSFVRANYELIVAVLGIAAGALALLKIVGT